MAGDVDHVVDATEDAVIAVGRLHRAVAGEIRPIAPVLAVPPLAIARIILRDEAVWIAPDRLENPRPRVLDADVAGLARPLRDLVAVVVIDHRVDAGNPRTGAARLHRPQGRPRAA